MNKVLVLSLFTVSSFITVYAEEVSFKKEIFRAATVQPAYGQARIATSSPKMMRLKQNVTAANKNSLEGEQGKNGMPDPGAPVRMPLPVTGDPEIDAQIKTLSLEMETKIRTIHDEYRAKVEALIGGRQLQSGKMMASGTPVRMNQNVRVEQAKKAIAPQLIRGETMVKGASTGGVEENNEGAVSGIQEEGMRMQFGGFLRNMFKGQ